jgi:hypothetical protein
MHERRGDIYCSVNTHAPTHQRARGTVPRPGECHAESGHGPINTRALYPRGAVHHDAWEHDQVLHGAAEVGAGREGSRGGDASVAQTSNCWGRGHARGSAG